MYRLWQLSSQVAESWPTALEVLGLNPGPGAQEFSKLIVISCLSIACDLKLESALYLVFYAKASERSWTSLNE